MGFLESFQIIWSDKVDERVKRSWKDKTEATEYAAVGIATLLTEYLLNLKIVERSYIGTNVDYILGEMSKDDSFFRQKAKLEISGQSYCIEGNSQGGNGQDGSRGSQCGGADS